MSKKNNGVLYIKYKDDKEAKNGRGIAVHLYQDVKYYGFLAEGINLLKIELEDDNREAIYSLDCIRSCSVIPVSDEENEK